MEYFTGAMVVAFSLSCGVITHLIIELRHQKNLVKYYKGNCELLKSASDDVLALFEDEEDDGA